jgi:hypothetical protein
VGVGATSGGRSSLPIPVHGIAQPLIDLDDKIAICGATSSISPLGVLEQLLVKITRMPLELWKLGAHWVFSPFILECPSSDRRRASR